VEILAEDALRPPRFFCEWLEVGMKQALLYISTPLSKADKGHDMRRLAGISSLLT
jgi:hypothetical protein